MSLTATDLEGIRVIVREETRTIVQDEVREIVRDEVRDIVRDETRSIVSAELKPIKEDIETLKGVVETLENGIKEIYFMIAELQRSAITDKAF